MCKIEHADICIRCEEVTETARHNHLRLCVCGKCAKELKKQMEHYTKHGLFLTTKE